MKTTQFLIVGSGLTGATIARQLSDEGFSVLVVDRRAHWGGNVHDHTHESGILVHTYGPHYFRTSSERIWGFVNRFSKFYSYEATLKTLVDGKLESWPIQKQYIESTVGSNWTPSFSGTPQNFEEASLSMMPRIIYDKFVREYTEKQWGVDPRGLAVSLAKRFDVRTDGDERLMRHKYQGIPELGYTGFIQRMLEGIPVILNFDYLKNRSLLSATIKTIYTGPIDEFFNFEYGKLQYRGQKRESLFISGIGYKQPCGQINNPNYDGGRHIRTLEWKHMMKRPYGDAISGTLLTTETPYSPENPDAYEYPFPDQSNMSLFAKYEERAKSTPDILICGRLGDYRYYDMDQAIARAMVLGERLLTESKK